MRSWLADHHPRYAMEMHMEVLSYHSPIHDHKFVRDSPLEYFYFSS